MKGFDDYVLNLSQWNTPITDYPEEQIGNFRIYRHNQHYGYYPYWGLDGYLFWRVRKPIPITYLQQKKRTRWHTWMLDDPPQYRAMQIYAQESKGRVLVAGLGLGLYLHELAKNKEVTDVTVVELNSEVLQLVGDHLPFSEFKFPIRIVIADFDYFIQKDHTKWDTIFVDLWTSDSRKQKERLLFHDVLPMVSFLRLKYPEAGITFHGFQSLSDIKPVKAEMVRLITKIGGLR